ncbi:EAL domain-containing protein [Azoarcus sp. L1K30]|uniref:sensor domain-containing phosphodiesterase n=1 Tax=Azoarcus sp. L1K30 TaxID=2820277 RepID=UPI001B842EDD|nr:EAL domain-containing protein [Azoarcus sp. L1K30]MBR0568708.1 EAL domain-containing protein [Azoarcus sp. L1K30]
MLSPMNHPGPSRGNANPDEPFVPDLSEGAETGVYLALLELIDEGLIITGDERIIDANSAACRMLERDYRQIAGRPLAELFVDERAFLDARARLFIQGEMRGTLQIALPDGAGRRFQFVAAARLRPGIHALIITPDPATFDSGDMSTTRAAAAGLADKVWPRLAAALVQPVIVVDDRNRVSAANAAAMSALGMDRANLIGHDASNCLRVRWPDAGGSSVARIQPRGQARPIHARMLPGPRTGWHLLLLPPVSAGPDAAVATIPIASVGARSTAVRVHPRIENSRLELHFQPLVHARDAAIHAGEALLRWHHPKQGLIPFHQFVDAARDEGRLPELGGWALRAACSKASAWPRMQGRALTVTVNISIEQILHGALVQQVTTALSESGIAPGRLELDLDEQVLAVPDAGLADTLQTLAELGVRLAIDDFGRGLSNIQRLKRYPVRALKLAPELVGRVGKEDESDALVEAIVCMAAPLGLKVLARGVENEAQQAFLLALGCELQQGPLFGLPMPEANFSDFLSDQLFC